MENNAAAFCFNIVSVCKYPHYYLYLVDNCDWCAHQNRTPKQRCSLWLGLLIQFFFRFGVCSCFSFVFQLRWDTRIFEPIVNKEETYTIRILYEMMYSWSRLASFIQWRRSLFELRSSILCAYAKNGGHWSGTLWIISIVSVCTFTYTVSLRINW